MLRHALAANSDGPTKQKMITLSFFNPYLRLPARSDPVSPQRPAERPRKAQRAFGIFHSCFSWDSLLSFDFSFDSITDATRTAGMATTNAATTAPANADMRMIFIAMYYGLFSASISWRAENSMLSV
jgi:hypothetical protein